MCSQRSCDVIRHCVCACVPPPPGCLTFVCLSRTSGLSREQRGLGRLKLAQEVAHVTRDSDTIFKVKGSKVKVTGAGGILWRTSFDVTKPRMLLNNLRDRHQLASLLFFLRRQSSCSRRGSTTSCFIETHSPPADPLSRRRPERLQ